MIVGKRMSKRDENDGGRRLRVRRKRTFEKVVNYKGGASFNAILNQHTITAAAGAG